MDAKAKRGAWIVTVALIILSGLPGTIGKPIPTAPCRLNSTSSCTLGGAN